MAIRRTMKLADAVLAYVEFMMDYDEDYVLEPYQNGREHGYLLRSYESWRCVAFSENRNSDDIVLYYGDTHDFQMAGNVPSESAYSKAKYISYEKAIVAAERIIAFLTPSKED